MLNLLKAVLLLVVALLSATAAFTVLDPNPDYPGQCYIPTTGEAHDVGATWPSESDCVQIMCVRARGKYGITTLPCPQPVETDCLILDGPGAHYPDCCPRAMCNVATLQPLS